jgi:hypothetical protein
VLHGSSEGRVVRVARAKSMEEEGGRGGGGGGETERRSYALTPRGDGAGHGKPQQTVEVGSSARSCSPLPHPLPPPLPIHHDL